MNGWCGKILRVNLTEGTIKTEELNPTIARQFIGARGLATKYLIDEVDPTVDALSPANTLYMATGPLTGTGVSTGGRYDVVTKSPLTGGIAGSNSGGYFPAELKHAGWDMIALEGRAETPQYLYIQDDKVELRDASHLWGKDTHATDDLIRAETDPKVKIACIGPGGENLVRIACIINDKHRAAGRSGVGAVMGSKNLKAVVVRGTGRVSLADEDAFKVACKNILTAIKESEVTSKGLPTYGTALLVNVINEHGMLPTRNFQQGTFDGANDTGGEAIAEKILTKKKACFACPIACGRATKVTEPGYEGEGEGPEYETTWALGADCGVNNLNAITKANYLCNELGIDTISAGATIACAMELNEKGFIPADEVPADLKFGNPQSLIDCVRDVAYRRGFGDVMAEGSYRMAEKYGHPELSMSSKKQEFPAYDPRGAHGMALGYATSNRGGCHVRGYTISPEILGLPEQLDPFAEVGKAFWVIAFQNSTSVVDSSGMCLFTTFAINLEHIRPALNAATGADYGEEELIQCGERIYNAERMFNLQAGLTCADDSIPPRLSDEPMPDGAAKGQTVNLAPMLAEYYAERGWDTNGVPTPEKLKQLGLA